MTELTLSSGAQVLLMPSPAKKFRGTILPGAGLVQTIQEAYTISFREVAEKLFRLSLRSFQCHSEQTFTLREASKYLRFETVLSGELLIREPNGETVKLLSGQYRITDVNLYQLPFRPEGNCELLIMFISPDLLLQTPMAEMIVPTAPMMMYRPMRDVLYRLFDNPFEERLRDAFYDYSIRELLFYHISAPAVTQPGELSPAEVAAVYHADQIIAADLSIHHSLQDLSRMTRTNMHALKTGFAKLFGMGTFERLLQRKMERAKYLLEKTDKQIQDIAQLAGYETVTGFINAFRKQFSMTPKDWRKQSRGQL